MNTEVKKTEAGKIAVLFARSDSVYKNIEGVDVWDKERDARNYSDLMPIVGHPPCRGWGRLRQFAKPEPGEKELAVMSVDVIRKNGGVLEHPAGSTLWKHCDLPKPGNSDSFGGFTIQVLQFWWGHKAAKSTWLYCCGMSPSDIPPAPLVFDVPTHVVSGTRGKKKKPEITKAEREHTPLPFAEFLIGVARLALDDGRKYG
jgi:hypothetical protein